MFAAAGWAQGKEYTLDVDAFYDNATETWRDIDKKPITGIINVYYESGKIKLKTPYKNGKVEGLFLGYYESGKIRQETPYKNDKAEGLSKVYYESGKINAETFFKKGKMEGIYKRYSESGETEQEINYKNSEKEGLAKSYLKNGALLELQYKKGVAVSGVCVGLNGKRTPLTNPEIAYWNNGESIVCR
jgi:antitoxin component YwqK of YwqJK toxin-antitoxin module